MTVLFFNRHGFRPPCTRTLCTDIFLRDGLVAAFTAARGDRSLIAFDRTDSLKS